MIVLVSRAGTVHEMVVAGPPLPPSVRYAMPRSRAAAAGSDAGDPARRFPTGDYVKVPIVDRLGRVVYVQRW